MRNHNRGLKESSLGTRNKTMENNSENNVEAKLEEAIMRRIASPGWTSVMALLKDPSSGGAEHEVKQVETAMKRLAENGKVRLWTLIMEHEEGKKLLAASRLDMELDKELEKRGAWASAVPYSE